MRKDCLADRPVEGATLGYLDVEASARHAANSAAISARF